MAHSTSSLYYRPSARHSLSSLLCFDECWSHSTWTAFDTSKFTSWQDRRIQLLLLALVGCWFSSAVVSLDKARQDLLATLYFVERFKGLDALNSFARSAQSICSALLLYYPLTSYIDWGDCTCVLRLPKTSTPASLWQQYGGRWFHAIEAWGGRCTPSPSEICLLRCIRGTSMSVATTRDSNRVFYL